MKSGSREASCRRDPNDVMTAYLCLMYAVPQMVRRPSPFGFGLVMLALCVQLVLGAWVPSAEGAPRLTGLGVICHADAGSRPPGSTPHHAPDCALCPLCTALAAPLALLAPPPPMVSPRTAVLVSTIILPPATVPPLRESKASQPRGPPVQG
jgi:hypothetical protein